MCRHDLRQRDARPLVQKTIVVVIHDGLQEGRRRALIEMRVSLHQPWQQPRAVFAQVGGVKLAHGERVFDEFKCCGHVIQSLRCWRLENARLHLE